MRCRGWVHIRFLGDGGYGFRPYGGSLWKSPKVTKGLLPHHSAPRLGSVCPHSVLNPWAAVTGHPWPNTANPASCRVTHGFKPAFGQRGLTGRLRSRSRSTARRPSSRPEWLKQKQGKSRAKAELLFCGSWLACDAGTSVHQANPVDAIAGKPAPTLTEYTHIYLMY